MLYEITFPDGSVVYTDEGESTRDIELLIKKHDKAFRIVDATGVLRTCYCFPLNSITWIYLYKRFPKQPRNYAVSYIPLSYVGDRVRRHVVVGAFKAAFANIISSSFLENVK